jgi:hypothetical protein
VRNSDARGLWGLEWGRMPVDPDKALVPARAALRGGPRPAGFGWGLFCASPTVLEAINSIRQSQGLSTLHVLSDGTIGSPEPLMLRVEYIPSPFVY